jgi:hypothetical protein
VKMEYAMVEREDSWLTWGDRDCWPFARIVIVGAVLGAAAHHCLGWRIDARRLMALPGQVLGVLSMAAMISFVLAELYLLLFAIPVYVIGVLNDWFYDASRWLGWTVFRLRSTVILALAGVCGEILFFGGAIYLLRVFVPLTLPN